MNNKILLPYLVLIIAPPFFGCHGPVVKENDPPVSYISPGQKYIIDTKESAITWKGLMLLASAEEHVGYVYLSKGELIIEDAKGNIWFGAVGGVYRYDGNTIR